MNLPVIVCLLSSLLYNSVYCGEDTPNKLPDCSENSIFQVPNGIILVSTLDGRLTALNANAGNMVVWSVPTGPGSLLSSSIHKLELTNNGQWVRMIPSLSGGLYKFNGINIESLPVKADHLLQSSSFLLNDGLIISGGRESRIYSVDLDTGETLYECSMNGCVYHNNISSNTIIIQRHTQTVRAIDMHTGNERWNFSVGQHDVQLPFSSNCHAKQSTSLLSDFEVKAIIPEGIVYATSKSHPNKVLWNQKFEAPVVAVWKFEDGKIHPIDLFHKNLWTVSPSENQQATPILYIGMHRKQLYIQETSPNFMGKSSKLIRSEASETLEVPWDPVSATGTSLALAEARKYENNEDDDTTTALSILYGSEYVNGNGYYLFQKNSESLNADNQCNPDEEANITDSSTHSNEFGDDDTPVHIIIVSLWYWWKEVLIISFVTAILVNLIITQPVLQMVQMGPLNIIQKEIVFIEKPAPPENNSTETQISANGNNTEVTEYKSRYLLDFETVQCLGRGGFGIVFEAKNKIDECNYAVKRIQLPNSEEPRERVLREVKTLAKLDHPHIVRYFNSWMECPPPKWLENHDSLYCKPSSLMSGMDSNGGNEQSAIDSGDSFFERSISVSKAENINHSFQNPPCTKYSMTNSDCSFILFEDSKTNMDKTKPHPSNDNVSVNVEDTVSVKITDGSSFSQINFDENTQSADITSSSKGSKSKLNAIKPLSLPTKVYLYIQMQLCHEKSLRDWLCHNSFNRDKYKMLQIFEQILQAVEYIHLEGLIHRDLKPSNIFFSINGQIKVGDFGLVTNMANTVERNLLENKFLSDKDEKHTAQVGTQLYMSPEQVEGLSYDYKVDIYSLGLILFELLYPFSTQMERSDTIRALRKNQFPATFMQHFENEYRVLSLMLSHNPKERPTSFDIRAKLPYLDSLKFNKWEQTSGHLNFDLPVHSSHCKNSFLDYSEDIYKKD